MENEISLCAGLLVRAPASGVLGIGTILKMDGDVAEGYFWKFWPPVRYRVAGLEVVRADRVKVEVFIAPEMPVNHISLDITIGGSLREKP